MEIKLYNTANRKKEKFSPIVDKVVSMYSCGPTVYGRAHIGNMRSFVVSDLLRRAFEQNGYKVKKIMNITDVGHLVGDEDEGEDKIEKEAKIKKKSVADVVAMYTELFFKDINSLNIKNKDTIFPKASDHIVEQINLVKALEEKDFTYKIKDGIYFDTSKFPEYTKFANLNTKGLKEGARVGINKEKRNITDFALWKFSGLEENRQQEWESPWGTGFPGWHLECSAMSMKYLGKTFDVHTGGVDHIPVHHTNEIAQSECATGKPLANYWIHNEFVNVDGERMAKSIGNTFSLDDLQEKGVSPIAYRLLLLMAHYRTLINFTWESALGAQNALDKIYNHIHELSLLPNGDIDKKYLEKFNKLINDDLDTPKAIALMWDLLRDKKIAPENKKVTVLLFDKIFGLGLSDTKKAKIPSKVQILVSEREIARQKKDWGRSDRIRKKINLLGYEVRDTDEGPITVKN